MRPPGFLLLLFCGFGLAQEPYDPASYSNAVKRLEVHRLLRMAELKSQYRAALEKLEAQIRERGQLDPLLLVRKEIEALDALDPQADFSPGGSGLPALVSLQEMAHRGMATIRREQVEARHALDTETARTLDQQVKSLTQSGRIEAALSARTQLAEVRASLAAGREAMRLIQFEAQAPAALAALRRQAAIHLPFDGVRGNGVPDMSGNRQHGTLLGGKPVEGRVGAALRFAGGTDGVRFPVAAFEKPGPKSVSVWLRLADRQSTYARVLHKGDVNRRSSQFVIAMNDDGNLWASCKPIDARRAVQTLTVGAIAPGEWHQVTVTWDGADAVRVYIDGELDPGRDASISWISYEGNQAVIGRRLGATPQGFQGDVDEFLFFNKELSAEEARLLAR